jgi:uncharacterized protein involved in exopolysaccharide biosynthesis
MDQHNSSERSLREWARSLGRFRVAMASVAALVLAVVTVWTFTATPRFRSQALVRIDSRQSGGSGLLDQVASLPSMGLSSLSKDEMETDIGVLRSRRMIDAAIDSVALTVRIVEPAGDRGRLVRARIRDTSDVAGRLTLARRSDGRYDLTTADWKAGAMPSSAIVAIQDTLRIGSVTLHITADTGTAAPDRIVIQFLPRFVARALVSKRLDVRRQESGSRLVLVRYDDEDRRLAADVVRRLVTDFIAFSLQNERRDNTSQSDELRRTIAEQRTKLATSEEQLRAYQQKSRLVVPEEQATAQVKRIAALNAQLDIVTVERAALARLLAIVEPRARTARDASAYRQLATFPSLISNRAIQDLLQSLLELENKRSELGVRRADASDEMRAYTTRISELELQLNRVGNQYLESLDQQIATAGQQVRTLADTLQALPDQEMQFVRLVRERTINNESYLILLKQLRVTELQDALRLERIRVVDAPIIAHPDDPEYPRPFVQLLLGAVLAGLLALTTGILLDQWRPRS